ncbi:hypothetical protein ONZ45_g4659 [Pleurotus djamor]|nr:hypothetical protein ONZ45_g4659 [Pleurotus djamor]
MHRRRYTPSRPAIPRFFGGSPTQHHPYGLREPVDSSTSSTSFLSGLSTSFMQMFGLSSLVAATGLGGNAQLTDSWKVLILGGLIEAGRRLFSWVFERFSFKYSMTARFAEGDPAYEWIILFLTEKKVWHRSRNFWVDSKTSARKWGIAPGGEKHANSKDDSTDYVPIYEIPQLFRWKGYWLEIHKEVGRPRQHRADIPEVASLHLTIYSYDMSVLKSLIDEARQRYIEVSKPNVIIHSSDSIRSGGPFTWNKAKSKVRRPLSSVILPQGELQSLLSDAQDFLNSDDWYVEAGIPYRRGYLLYGPPGTGKSSTIYALAGELGLEIYTISLATDFVDDLTLQDAVASVPKRSILLIEDIDCAFPSREEEEEEELRQSRDPFCAPPSPWGGPMRRGSAVTMSGLLNILDGVDSEEGKFFIATTNYVDRLDPALIRPGRIDKKIRYSLADSQQIRALFLRFFPESRFGGNSEKPLDISTLVEEFCAGIPPEEFSVAELQGYLLSRRHSPLDAVADIQGWVANERQEREDKEKREAERKAKLRAAKDRANGVPGVGGPSHFGGPISRYTPLPPKVPGSIPTPPQELAGVQPEPLPRTRPTPSLPSLIVPKVANAVADHLQDRLSLGSPSWEKWLAFTEFPLPLGFSNTKSA